MFVYFLRHASASQSLNDPKKDEKRPLDEQGITQSAEVGRALAALGVHLDAIITSPLKRATQTASLVANELGYERKLDRDDALRPEASWTAFRELLRRYSTAGHEAVMVVGHNPSLSSFLGRAISGGHDGTGVELKKGAVARVDWDRGGTLNWCLTPKLVRVLTAGGKRK